MDDLHTLPLCISIRLTDEQTAQIKQAAAAARSSPGVWAQRHLLAALGCLPADSLEEIGKPVGLFALAVLEDITARHAYFDSLLVEKQ